MSRWGFCGIWWAASFDAMPLYDAFGRPYGTPAEADAWAERGQSFKQDAWVNQQTGLGVWGLDKTKGAAYWPVYRVLDQELTSLMNGSDIASKIVSKRVDEMFRRGWELEGSINGKPLKDSEVKDCEQWAAEYLDLQENMREGARWGRAYGGALNVMTIDDGRPLTEPLDEENIRDFYNLALVDRRYAYVQSQYAAMAASRPGYKYGRPQIYLISNAIAGYGWNEHGPVEKISERSLREGGAQVSLVHESRVIRFDGNPADVVTRQQLAGWSWSVLQRVYDAMRQFDTSFDSAMYLLQDASQGVFKLQGLIKSVSTGQRAALLARMQMVEMTRSVVRGIALDAGGPDGKNAESFERQPTPFSGIPELIQVMMLRLSAAADMPATELFGRAPQGMNATGESDTRKWYDTIESEQKNNLGPRLERVFKILGLSKKGPIGGRKVDWKIHFRPLQSPTDKELADTRLANSQRDQIYIQTGVVKPEEVAVDLAEVYPNIDIEAREDVLEKGLMFDPYENEEPPQNSASVNASGQGEPLSPKAPVPLMGTSGTNIDPGSLPQLGKSEAASSGEAGRQPGKSAIKQDAVLLPDAAICIVRDPSGRVLCVTRPEPPHEFAIPGGTVDPGETPIMAAGRELKEECGIDTFGYTAHGTLRAPTDGRTVYVFSASGWRGEAIAAEPGTRIAWLTPQELLEQATLYRSEYVWLMHIGALVAAPSRQDARETSASRHVDDAMAMAETLVVARDDADGVRYVLRAILSEYRASFRADAPNNNSTRVYQQLSEDFPTRLLGWVLASPWIRRDVPTEEINSANRDQWTASHDGKLESFKDKASEGGPQKPAILVQTPDNDLLDIVDGHHRYLAHEAIGKPIPAYVGTVHSKHGPWLTLHDAQRGGASGPSYQGPSWQALAASADVETDRRDASVRSKWTLDEATKASAEAKSATDSATDEDGHAKASSAHAIAAKAHRYLAGRHENLKNSAAADMHLGKADEHDAAAAAHREGLCASSPPR